MSERFQWFLTKLATTTGTKYAIVWRPSTSISDQLDDQASSEERVRLQNIRVRAKIQSNEPFYAAMCLVFHRQGPSGEMQADEDDQQYFQASPSSMEGYLSAALGSEMLYKELDTKLARFLGEWSSEDVYVADLSCSYTPPKRLRKSFWSTEQIEDVSTKRIKSMIYVIMFDQDSGLTNPAVQISEFTEIKFVRSESLANLF